MRSIRGIRPVRYGLATAVEIDKALKKYYGVGAETLDELEEDEPIELVVSEDKEILPRGIRKPV